MISDTANKAGRRTAAALLVTTILAGGTAAGAQEAPATEPPAAQRQEAPGLVIRSIRVEGNQRLEPETILSYTDLRAGQAYSRETLDQALKDLFDTELFANVQILGADTGNLVIEVVENPVINRVIFEGNKRLKEDEIRKEIRLAPRQIFTRSRVRAAVARVIELYRRQGRFGARVEPQIVELDQNRVDVVFEIEEGPRSKVRQINILGNEAFSDGRLRDEMATKRTGFFSFLSSSDSYDPDRLAFDQQKLRQFYLTEGYADFRVVSAVAELTPDKRDFIITYVVEEGERYRFGDVAIDSDIEDYVPNAANLPIEAGDWYNAKLVEDSVNDLSEAAGLFGYAFAEVNPRFERDRDAKTIGVTFKIEEAPRVYVDRIDIRGNVNTRDKVIRREFRLAEGDPFNSVLVKRSRDRIQSLGFFQDDLEIEQTRLSDDRVALGVDVQEKSTGELQFSAGFSSIERFILAFSVRQRNFLGKGQTLRASVNYSNFSNSVELGFTEPYLFDRNIAVGFDLFRRDFNSFRFGANNDRETTYEQITTGGQLRAGVPLTEYLSVALRYGLSVDDVFLDESTFFSDIDGDGVVECNPRLAGRFLCDQIGERTASAIGYSLVYSSLNNRLRPTRGERFALSQDFAGLGGDVRYLRTRGTAAKYWDIGRGLIFSLSAEGGYIHSFEDQPSPGSDPVRIIDRFFLGEPQIRGFDIRGIGPRVLRIPRDGEGNLITDDPDAVTDDALGGKAYYLGRAELELPLGESVRELGLRPSIFVDAGALFSLVDPPLTDVGKFCVPLTGGATTAIGPSQTCPPDTTPVPGFKEVYLGDTPSPRVSFGIGLNWNSPFGPFRLDIARAIVKEPGDDTKFVSFNVGTAF
ncbi:MAG: outer membrane protein assembly factor BamA [Sphingomonadaceae bacterium]